MRIWLTIGFVFLLVGFQAQAGDSRGHYEQLFDTANAQYSQGNYEGAIATYEEVLQAGYVSSALYFNLGNAQFKSGNLAPAIWAFEKAKKLDPSDSDVQFNLELASSQTTDKIERLSNNTFNNWWIRLIHWLDADVWGGIGIGLLLLFLAALVSMLGAQSLSVKRSALAVGGIAFIGLFCSLWFGFQQLSYQQSESAAIVFSPTVTVKSEPSDQGNQLFNLHEGTKVTLLEVRNDWYNIALSDGKTGWLQASNLRII